MIAFRNACLIVGIAVAITTATATSRAATKSGTPPTAACTWIYNGLEEDGWVCLCQRVRFKRGWQLVCDWHLADTVYGRIEARKPKPRIHAKPPKATRRVAVIAKALA